QSLTRSYTGRRSGVSRLYSRNPVGLLKLTALLRKRRQEARESGASVEPRAVLEFAAHRALSCTRAERPSRNAALPRANFLECGAHGGFRCTRHAYGSIFGA